MESLYILPNLQCYFENNYDKYIKNVEYLAQSSFVDNILIACDKKIELEPNLCKNIRYIKRAGGSIFDDLSMERSYLERFDELYFVFSEQVVNETIIKKYKQTITYCDSFVSARRLNDFLINQNGAINFRMQDRELKREDAASVFKLEDVMFKMSTQNYFRFKFHIGGIMRIYDINQNCFADEVGVEVDTSNV